MAEFEINGRTFRSTKMNVFEQLHVARKLLPLLGTLMDQFNEADFKSAELDAPEPVDEVDVAAPSPASRKTMAKVITAIGTALSNLSQEDTESVLGSCLSVVTIRQAKDSWVKIWNKEAKRLQFEDLTLIDLLLISQKVIEENVGNFFPGAAPSTAKLRARS
ncbi:MAG: hypothetical protein PHU06_06115 [Gallionella sp.]|nr:hypothetical protein [Gallionella sp.]MDD4958385.1 hypothetical protein [Gallionella sp.]